MTRPAFELPLKQAAVPISASPGEMITIRGAVYSTHDGVTIDGASTTWPATAPGGASVDSGGLIDFTGSGFALISRDASSHVITVVANGHDAPGCAEQGVPAPCLLLRTREHAHGRLLTVDQYVATLRGELRVEGATVGGTAGLAQAAELAHDDAGLSPLWAASAALLVAVTSLLLLLGWWRRWSTSVSRRLAVQIKQLRHKCRRTDPVLAAVLVPELRRVSEAVRRGRLDPASVEGRRVTAALRQLGADLDDADQAERTRQETATADELVQQLQSAVVAAVEAGGEGARTMIRSTNR